MINQPINKNMFASFIKRIKNIAIKSDINTLGRWQVESCDKKIGNKVDWSNTDHCGPCGNEKLVNKTLSILKDSHIKKASP